MPSKRPILAALLTGLTLHIAGLGAVADDPQVAGQRSRTAGGARLLKIGGKYEHVRGINLAWLNGACGHDFGRMPAHPDWGVAFDPDDLDRYFADMRRMGLNVVRIWVFEACEGLLFDAGGCVRGIDPGLLKNFDVAVKLASGHGLHLYLCLGAGYAEACRSVKAGDILADPRARQAYLEHAVAPFVARYKGDPIVFAIDIYNEPQFEAMDGTTWAVMRSFLRENATAIHRADPKRLVSCGVGAEEIRAGRMSGLGLDFYDVHRYGDGGLPTVAELGVKTPVLLGEFGPGNQAKGQDDEAQKAAVENFLRNARDGGYAGAVYWDYAYPGIRVESNLNILRGGGSAEWRPAAYVLRDFRWDEPRKASAPRRTPAGRYRVEIFNRTLGVADPPLDAILSDDGAFRATSGLAGAWEALPQGLLVRTKEYGPLRFKAVRGGRFTTEFTNPQNGNVIRLEMSKVEREAAVR